MTTLDHPFKAEIQTLRQAIPAVDPAIAEGIKWNAPSWRTSEYFATTHLRSKTGLGLILHLGAKARQAGAMITLYDCATAPSPRRARILLAEKGVVHSTVQVDLRTGEQMGDAYRAINPQCTVPALRTEEGSLLADNAAIVDQIHFRPITALEPTVLLACVAAATTHIGLIATASTSYNEPYTIARKFASLDHLSGGRAGWNLVTALIGGENFNRAEHLQHADRYQRAGEFFEVVTGLWDSWADD
eukprot:gene7315-9064_t